MKQMYSNFIVQQDPYTLRWRVYGVPRGSSVHYRVCVDGKPSPWFESKAEAEAFVEKVRA